jgi:hypothetical protein
MTHNRVFQKNNLITFLRVYKYKKSLNKRNFLLGISNKKRGKEFSKKW